MSIAGIALATQAGLGLAQTVGGLLTKKPTIPEAEIPQEVMQNLSDAEYWSLVGMPEEQRQRYIDDLKSSTATALRNVGTRKGGLGAISSAYQAERQGLKEITDLDTEVRMRNLDRLYQARDRVAQTRTAADDVNREIAMFKYGERNKLIGAGMQNIMGAFGTASMADSLDGDMFSFMAGAGSGGSN
jgi:hypothetical protein